MHNPKNRKKIHQHLVVVNGRIRERLRIITYHAIYLVLFDLFTRGRYYCVCDEKLFSGGPQGEKRLIQRTSLTKTYCKSFQQKWNI